MMSPVWPAPALGCCTLITDTMSAATVALAIPFRVEGKMHLKAGANFSLGVSGGVHCNSSGNIEVSSSARLVMSNLAFDATIGCVVNGTGEVDFAGGVHSPALWGSLEVVSFAGSLAVRGGVLSIGAA